MNTPQQVTIASFTLSSREHKATGLLGWLTIDIGGLVTIDGITLRRTNGDGRLVLSFPVPRKSNGKRGRSVVRPASESARIEIESAVFVALGLTEEGPA